MVSVVSSTRTFCPSLAVLRSGRKSTVSRAMLAAFWLAAIGSCPPPATPTSATKTSTFSSSARMASIRRTMRSVASSSVPMGARTVIVARFGSVSGKNSTPWFSCP